MTPMLDFYIWNSLLVWHFEIEVEANRTWCRVRWMVGGWLECKYSNIWEWYGAARQMKMIEAELCPLLYFESSRIKIIAFSTDTWHGISLNRSNFISWDEREGHIFPPMLNGCRHQNWASQIQDLWNSKPILGQQSKYINTNLWRSSINYDPNLYYSI